MHRRGDPGRHEEEEAAAGPSRRAPSSVLRALLALEAHSVAPALAGLSAGLLSEARRALAVWMLEDWEPVVLGKLQWGLMLVTSQEFLDPILQLLPLPRQEMVPLVKKHAQALVVSWAIGVLESLPGEDGGGSSQSGGVIPLPLLSPSQNLKTSTQFCSNKQDSLATGVKRRACCPALPSIEGLDCRSPIIRHLQDQ